MPATIITSDDLREFKMDLLEDIKYLIAQSPTSLSNRYIKSGDVKKMLRISHATLQRFRSNGIIPFTMVGGIIFYEVSEIEKVMKANRVASNSKS
ncbi:helix-turn-helix domain-containing protein [Dokdonia genika]|uniref:Helix-turn-helix domain-containing protein n=1 Tax=Dokdonia genika TaxID=308113 RepID=A0ABV9L765_9FLAO